MLEAYIINIEPLFLCLDQLGCCRDVHSFLPHCHRCCPWEDQSCPSPSYCPVGDIWICAEWLATPDIRKGKPIKWWIWWQCDNFRLYTDDWVVCLHTGAVSEYHHAAPHLWGLLWADVIMGPVQTGIRATAWERENWPQDRSVLCNGYMEMLVLH